MHCLVIEKASAHEIQGEINNNAGGGWSCSLATTAPSMMADLTIERGRKSKSRSALRTARTKREMHQRLLAAPSSLCAELGDTTAFDALLMNCLYGCFNTRVQTFDTSAHLDNVQKAVVQHVVDVVGRPLSEGQRTSAMHIEQRGATRLMT